MQIGQVKVGSLGGGGGGGGTLAFSLWQQNIKYININVSLNRHQKCTHRNTERETSKSAHSETQKERQARPVTVHGPEQPMKEFLLSITLWPMKLLPQ